MHRLRLILAILAVVVISAGLALWLVAPNIAAAVRPLIVGQIESVTGRKLTIAGDLRMTPSFVPTVVAHKVIVENAPWGSKRPMLEVRALAIEFRLIPLVIHREIVIDRLVLDGASLLIERDASGVLNWQKGSYEEPDQVTRGKVGTPPYIAELKIVRSSIVWHDLAGEAWETISIDNLTSSARNPTAPLQVNARGAVNDLPIRFAGHFGPIAQLFGGNARWSVDLSGQIQEAAVTARGTIDLNGQTTDLALTAKGERVETLGPLLNAKLPALGTYEAAGRLVGAIAAPALQGASARIGDLATAELRVGDGRVGNLARLKDVRLPLTLRAENLERAARMVGLALPSLKPLSGDAVLVRDGKGYALERISVRAGDELTQMGLTGSVADVFASPVAKLEVSARAKSPDTLGVLVGQPLGAIGPLRLSARLSNKGSKFQIADLSLELDKTDVRGGLVVDLDASPTALRGELTSMRLDLQSIVYDRGAGFTDAETLPLKALRDAELHIRMRADSIVLANARIGPASALVDLKDGRLALNDLDIKTLGGSISGNVVVTEKDGKASAGPLASVDLKLRADKLDLSKLLTTGATAPGDNLPVSITVALDSEGRTGSQLRANLSGEASVFSNGGKIFGSGLNRLVLDINPLRLLPPFWGSAEVVNVSCLAYIAKLNKGIAETYLVLDTERMTLLGEGSINLRDRQIDLTLDPLPKSRLPSATGVPVRISGPLDSPKVDPLATQAVSGLFKGLVRRLTSPLNQIARLFGDKARDACASAVPQ